MRHQTLAQTCAVIPVVILVGCTAATPAVPAAGTLQGESKPVYGATVATWAKQGDDKSILEVGVTLPIAFAENAPTDAKSPTTSVAIDFPAEVKAKTFLDHISLDYNPVGHQPPGIYDTSHYDFHFYSVSQAQVDAVDCSDKTAPSSDRMAENYMFVPPPNGQCEPKMGYHAVDSTSPELAPKNPAKFTKTMVMGYYGGSLTFLEPMVTRETLLARQDFSFKVPKPAVVGKKTLYPTTFNATYDKAANAYKFVLSGFQAVN